MQTGQQILSRHAHSGGGHNGSTGGESDVFFLFDACAFQQHNDSHVFALGSTESECELARRPKLRARRVVIRAALARCRRCLSVFKASEQARYCAQSIDA